MSAFGRANQRVRGGATVLRASRVGPGPSDGRGPPQNRRYSYERLVQVDLQHDYFNRSRGACPAFSLAPTRATAEMMKATGLLFLDEGTSFSVLYDFNRRSQFLKSLERRNASGQWTWLSFVLVPNTLYFINITELPIDFHPARYNLYFNNTQAHYAGEPASPTDQARHCAGTRDPVVLNPGLRVTTESRQQVVQAQVQVTLASSAVAEVTVNDLSGQVVLRKPCDAPGQPPDVYLDFGVLTEGLYTVRQVDRQGVLVKEHTVLYTQPAPLPLCFVDLLLVKPSEDSTGIYPICDLEAGADKARVVPLQATLRFERRQTRWCYYVIPPKGVEYESLSIHDVGAGPPVSFTGPEPVILPGLVRAFRFIADAELPLQEVPDLHFELKGQRALTRYEKVLVERLPVASPRQVLPREGTPPGSVRLLRPSGQVRGPPPTTPPVLRSYSDIYVNL